MLKRLVAGQMSLPMTFWGWGICGNFLLGLIGLAGVQTGHPAMVLILTRHFRTAFVS